jgi:DNA-binding CsgD family transcriptional regulator
MAASTDAVCAQVADLAGRSTSGPEFGEIVSAAVGTVLPFDGWCLLGMDPRSGLRTFQFGRHGVERTAEMAYNEALQPDVNKYAALAKAKLPAGWLAKGHPLAGESVRFNEILRPQGFGSEVRLALRQQGLLWGALALFRDHDRRDFTDNDTKLLLQLGSSLVEAIRRYPVRPVSSAPPGLPPGMVLLSPENVLLSVSPGARAWLDDLVPGGSDETWPSDVTRVLFDAANAVRAAADTAPQSAATRIRTVSGRWLYVQGTRLLYGEADVCVILQAATLRQLLPTVIDAHGLTEREGNILTRVAAGSPAKHIARELQLSPHTVNDHLKSIYRKTRVSGREELMGRFI